MLNLSHPLFVEIRCMQYANCTLRSLVEPSSNTTYQCNMLGTLHAICRSNEGRKGRSHRGPRRWSVGGVHPRQRHRKQNLLGLFQGHWRVDIVRGMWHGQLTGLQRSRLVLVFRKDSELHSRACPATSTRR